MKAYQIEDDVFGLNGNLFQAKKSTSSSAINFQSCGEIAPTISFPNWKTQA